MSSAGTVPCTSQGAPLAVAKVSEPMNRFSLVCHSPAVAHASYGRANHIDHVDWRGDPRPVAGSAVTIARNATLEQIQAIVVSMSPSSRIACIAPEHGPGKRPHCGADTPFASKARRLSPVDATAASDQRSPVPWASEYDDCDDDDCGIVPVTAAAINTAGGRELELKTALTTMYNLLESAGEADDAQLAILLHGLATGVIHDDFANALALSTSVL